MKYQQQVGLIDPFALSDANIHGLVINNAACQRSFYA